MNKIECTLVKVIASKNIEVDDTDSVLRKLQDVREVRDEITIKKIEKRDLTPDVMYKHSDFGHAMIFESDRVEYITNGKEDLYRLDSLLTHDLSEIDILENHVQNLGVDIDMIDKQYEFETDIELDNVYIKDEKYDVERDGIMILITKSDFVCSLYEDGMSCTSPSMAEIDEVVDTVIKPAIK